MKEFILKIFDILNPIMIITFGTFFPFMFLVFGIDQILKINMTNINIAVGGVTLSLIIGTIVVIKSCFEKEIKHDSK